MWSVPVASGTATGWVDAEGHRLNLNGWRAYHDHTWGQFRPGTPSWVHSDFVVNIPRPGEAWIVNGLEPEEKGYRVKPDDSRWQGVLVHVNGTRVSTCRPRIARSGWTMYPNHVDGWDYWLPNKVSAQCGRSSFSAEPERVPWGLTGFMHAILGSTPIRGRSGWIEHATPVFPNV
jgi:hypothetical protein